MIKFSLMYIVLTLFPLTLSANIQCDLSVRRAISFEHLYSRGVQMHSKQEQLNNVTHLNACASRAVQMLKERCLETNTGVADAIITHSRSGVPSSSKALIRGTCTNKSIMTLLGKSSLGFVEVERFGFIEQK